MRQEKSLIGPQYKGQDISYLSRINLYPGRWIFPHLVFGMYQIHVPFDIAGIPEMREIKMKSACIYSVKKNTYNYHKNLL